MMLHSLLGILSTDYSLIHILHVALSHTPYFEMWPHSHVLLMKICLYGVSEIVAS